MSKTNYGIWSKPLEPNKVYYYTFETSGSRIIKDYLIGLRAEKIIKLLKKL